MTRGPFGKPVKKEPESDRPQLEEVLELWGIDFSSRVSQMISCPLHEDTSPSCSINTDKQLFKCHSCGAGGDVWKLIMKKEGCDFSGAVKFAAAHGLSTGGSGGGGKPVRAGRFGGGSAVPDGSGNRGRDGGFKPSWRRG